MRNQNETKQIYSSLQKPVVENDYEISSVVSSTDVDVLSDDASASLQLGQDAVGTQEVDSSEPRAPSDDDEEGSCEEVAATEPRSRFNSAADKSLLAEVLATPPFSADRKALRSCHDRASLLLRKYAVRKRRNEAASHTSEVHTDDDDVLEHVLLLKEDAATRVQTKKAATAAKTQELETAGQRLMQAAEQRCASYSTPTWECSNAILCDFAECCIN
ncbi:hypothetical protein PHYPSEUDO_012690 [Phytophthora pseudosyringae]|uniref:Uncharacterized protein n=1 Tax=Phytophthora pseudosyringae TaxID=221518 RepID=A0A8T1V6C8_9STRA|nr:hypothetical protein PHYPSEUDO_012690 [Phytophthora pseudosyringae]